MASSFRLVSSGVCVNPCSSVVPSLPSGFRVDFTVGQRRRAKPAPKAIRLAAGSDGVDKGENCTVQWSGRLQTPILQHNGMGSASILPTEVILYKGLM
jgi:hypothetical protein